jgi:hypothetical protein
VGNVFSCLGISVPIGSLWGGGGIEVNIVGKVVCETKIQNFFRHSQFWKNNYWKMKIMLWK